MGTLRFKFGGVNNVLDSAEINESGENGRYTELAQATDVDFTDRLAVKRRPGREALVLTGAHSLWSNTQKNRAFLGYNFGLYELNTDFSRSLITALSSNEYLDFAEVNNAVAFSNGVDYGVVIDGVLISSPSTSKVGRIPTRPGVCLTFFNGRLFLANPDGTLYYTDPHDLFYMMEGQCRIPLGGIATMAKAVDNGIWVSTPTRLAFLRGDDATTFQWIDHGPYFAIPGASMVVSTKKLRGLNLPGEEVAVWASVKGVCLGTANGELINLSESKYSYAPGNRGAIMLRETDGLAHIIVAMKTVGENYNQDQTSITPVRRQVY